MVILRRVGGVLCALAILANLLACGSVTKVREAAQRVETANELKQIGLAYQSFMDANKGKPPASAAELAAWAGTQADLGPLVAVVNKAAPGGKFVIHWGTSFPKDANKMATTVLGYEAKAPTSGGAVMMLDGAVLQKTAAEFAALPKPGKDEDKNEKK